MGNGGQFRIGIHHNKVSFWIKEASPGSLINEKANYLIAFKEKEGAQLAEANSVKLLNEFQCQYKQDNVVIYKVIRPPQ